MQRPWPAAAISAGGCQVLAAETIAETLGRDDFGLRKIRNCAAEYAPGDAVLIERELRINYFD